MEWNVGDPAAKVVLIVVASGIGMLFLVSLFWGGTGYGMMGGGMMGLGWLVMLVPLLAIVFLVLFLVPGLSEDARPAPAYFPPGNPQPQVPPAPASLDILSQRYARGEISREDYLRMRQDISAANDCEEHC